MKPPQLCAASLLFFLVATSRAGAPVEQRTVAFKRSEQSTTVTVDSKQVSIEAAKAIERMRKHLEEWGTVNVSEPLLYPVSGQFSLGAATDFSTFKEYYAAELTNVTAAAGQLAQSALGASFTANYNASQYGPAPSPAAGAQTPGSTQGGSGAVANPQFPLAAPATATPTDVPASQVKGYLDQPTFHKPGELLATAPNGNAPRSAVSQSATDKITELLLRTMANPAPPDDGSKLYLAIFQVTCNPGWRTLKGYMADVYLNWEYARHLSDGTVALSLSNTETSAPTVVAMLPLVDAQNMDLRNSQRELYSLLASLSASGALGGGNAAGKGVLDYIRSYQKDAASRNAMPVVNSYSSGYGMGFRFSPSFVAISDPARKKSPSANMLIPTSFPVLAVLRMNKGETHPKKWRWLEGKEDGYDELALEQTFRWLIRDRRISLLPWDWHLPGRREDERRRLKIAQQSGTALGALKTAKDAYDNEAATTDPYTRADYQLLRTDYHELDYKAGTNWSYSPLRDDFLNGPKKPVILSCKPEVIDPTLDNKLTIQGKNLKADGLRVFLGGQECPVVSVDNERSVVAFFKAGNLSIKDYSTVIIPTSAEKSGDANDNPIPVVSSSGDGKPSLPGKKPLPSPAPAPTGIPGPQKKPVVEVGNAETDLVVATKTDATSYKVGIDLKKQREKKAKQDEEDARKTVKITRDSEGNIVSIDLSRFAALPAEDVLEATVKILGGAAPEKPDVDENGNPKNPKPDKKPKPGGTAANPKPADTARPANEPSGKTQVATGR